MLVDARIAAKTLALAVAREDVDARAVVVNKALADDVTILLATMPHSLSIIRRASVECRKL